MAGWNDSRRPSEGPFAPIRPESVSLKRVFYVVFVSTLTATVFVAAVVVFFIR
jgi:hypothetical protein